MSDIPDEDIPSSSRTPYVLMPSDDDPTCSQFLLDLGTDVNGEDSDGYSALHYAVEKGYMNTIELFLNRGADVFMRNSSNGLTPSHYLALTNNREFMKFLFYKAGKPYRSIQQIGGEGMAPIHMASMYGSYDIVLWLTESERVPVDTLSLSRKTALLYAVEHNQVSTADFLIDRGANVNFQTYDEGLATLHVAVRNGKVNMAKALAIGGADRSILCNTSRESPVHWATACGNLKILRNLNLQYSDATKPVGDDEGNRPVHLAAKHGYHNILSWLKTDKEVPIDTCNNLGYAPLHIAVQNSRLNVVKYLIEQEGQRVDTPTSNEERETPLHIASQNGNYFMIKYLIIHGADLNCASSYNGYRAVHYATSYDAKDCVKLLYDHGCCMNFNYGREGNTGEPLFITAVKNDSYNVASFLLDVGIPVTSRDLKGLTALHHAIRAGSREMINLLLTRKALVNSKDEDGQTPLHYAVERGDTDILHSVLQLSPIYTEDNGGMNPIHQAAANGNLPCLQILITNNAHFYLPACDKDKNLPIHLAAIGGHVDVVNWFIERGMEVDVCDEWGRTPLYKAALNGHENIVKCLIDRGASVNGSTHSEDGRTPLHAAITLANHNVIQTLIKHDADLNARAFRTRYTPLHWAVVNSDLSSVMILVRSGADTNAHTSTGRTARDLAESRNFSDIIDFLANREI